MSLPPPETTTFENAQVTVYPDEAAAAAGAARQAGEAIRAALAERGRARVVFASAPSQDAMLTALMADPSIDWSLVQGFQMDEYIGLPEGHPRRFGSWLASKFAPGLRFEPMSPGDDPAAEVERYAALLTVEPIDLTCLGIGVNGHIAFNEPGSAFDDPRPVRVIELDQKSRQQQVTEGLFAGVDDVPARAVTVTIPALIAARTLVTTVLGSHKADAVRAALDGPLSPDCPASVLRTHQRVSVHLDTPAASRLSAPA
jgi:glucosamine-6-phosphate deaminase